MRNMPPNFSFVDFQPGGGRIRHCFKLNFISVKGLIFFSIVLKGDIILLYP